ncbi:hypothetical protein GJ496_006546 [Pomphorhynchus laevis]|nr:hypothetical protein GJ496_006546 [Pomphorhynchus laevis]
MRQCNSHDIKKIRTANIDINQLDTVVVPSNDDESNLLSPTTLTSSAYQSNEPLHMISSMVSSCSSTFSTNSSSSNNLSVQCKMSEKVSSLTTAIYHELEQLIKDHGEHNYKMLMSLIISTLESLDVATHERDELDSEIDLLKEDREQLLTQWERERDLRKKSEEKYLQFEDLYEDRLKKQDDKSRKAQHALNLAEIKVKNALDHVSRLEDKEAEYKKNYAKLNERCNHLMRLKCENTERLRLNQPSTDNATGCSNAIRNRRQFSYSTESSNYLDSSASSREMFRNNSLPNNIPGAVTTGCSQGNKIQTVNIHNPFWEMAALDTQFEDFDFAEVRNSEDDNELCSLADDTSVCDSTGDTGITSSFFGMTKEVEKLINENNDLLATKNALNVLKDDLLEQLNEVTGKLKITECELNDAELNLKSKDNRICDLEVELKSERAKSQQTEIAEQNNNLSFTRADITRLITEKNLFKQKLMDLEDAIKWQDMLRSSKNKLINHSTTRKRTQIFNLFSSLFGSSLLTTNTSEVETNRTNDAFKSIPADIVKKNHNVKHCDSNEEESIHNDWLIPKDLQMATPMFIGKTILSKANIEQIRGHSTLFQNPSQIWITGAQSNNQQASRILVIDTNDVSQDEPLRLLYNCEVPYIVSSICQIPYASKRNEFYSQCEFCKRELSVKTNTLDDGYRLDFDSILLGTHDGRVLVIVTKLIDAKPLFSLNVKAAILTMK